MLLGAAAKQTRTRVKVIAALAATRVTRARVLTSQAARQRVATNIALAAVRIIPPDAIQALLSLLITALTARDAAGIGGDGNTGAVFQDKTFETFVTGRVVRAANAAVIDAAVGNAGSGRVFPVIGAVAGVAASAVSTSQTVGETGGADGAILVVASSTVKTSVGVATSLTAADRALALDAIPQDAEIPLIANQAVAGDDAAGAAFVGAGA
jgi:hypothetical protein